jgi:hypothetical protein
MSFDTLENDIVCLLKINGNKYENIKASVQVDKIFTSYTSTSIDEGDHLIRKLPNGKEEIFEVIDPVYYSGLGPLEPHYEIEVRKISKINKESKIQENSGHTIHFTGNNSRVIINSTDNSINIDMSGINEGNVFEELKKCISKNTEGENRDNLLSSVDNLEKAKGTERYTNAFKSFVNIAKDTMTILGPFIPYLASYIK